MATVFMIHGVETVCMVLFHINIIYFWKLDNYVYNTYVCTPKGGEAKRILTVILFGE